MCVAYPGLVLEVAATTALVETEGRQRRASLVLVPEAVVGDWVVVSAGTVLEIVDPDVATEIRALLDEDRRAEAAMRAAAQSMTDQLRQDR
jgi:hydrogenase expression/formation protein HypC